jgi:hypothetical protein
MATHPHSHVHPLTVEALPVSAHAACSSLLWPVWQRLGSALVLSALLWGGILWALS